MVQQTFTAIIHKEEHLYVAECPEVGTASQGYTLEEAVTNLKEATELYLEEMPLVDAGTYSLEKDHSDSTVEVSKQTFTIP
ncbi:MAG TPA: type II toxin-antitoxin system HicB family antitoxin [Ktedonobacteraceae bacterium]|nr:type II toxin-antitoxin system HicB family antitoxin [Ktedonobacteraceae bacterium]